MRAPLPASSQLATQLIIDTRALSLSVRGNKIVAIIIIVVVVLVLVVASSRSSGARLHEFTMLCERV